MAKTRVKLNRPATKESRAAGRLRHGTFGWLSYGARAAARESFTRRTAAGRDRLSVSDWRPGPRESQ